MEFKEKRAFKVRSISFSWKKIMPLVLCAYIIWSIKVIMYIPTEDVVESKFSEKILSNDSDGDINEADHDEKVNLKYCGKTVCQFMFPYFVPEQETRANLHLRSLTYLARSLNRIMVLPNVGNSKMHCCAPFPFEFYYDLEEMRRMFPDITFMTQQTFKEWTEELLIEPDTFHTWFIEDGRKDSYTVRDHEQMAVEPSETYSKSLKRNLCIDQFKLKISGYNEFHTGKKNMSNLPYNMANFLTENLKDIKSPVILIRNRSRKQMFPLIQKTIPYAPYIMKQALEIRKKLKSYYCVHWRMEQGLPRKMPACAKKLIETIDHLKETEGINTVYLATDYPIAGGKSASQSFYNVGDYHRRAIQMLNSTLNINTWVSLNAFEEFRKDKRYDSEFNSSGIHGILDKLTCINADYFLSGPEGCCRILSTYTKLIAQKREDLIDSGNEKLRNVITRWGTMKKD